MAALANVSSHRNGSSTCPVILQVIDEHQIFSDRLPEYIKQWNLYDAGFAYNLVAVFGSQSTGKSTLLNRVFGTDFDVMSESRRQQTTKGIWMSKGLQMPVLVLDVEGTDGRERGEDQDFERKSALFSMASAEVILVNLWEHQIGLYQGANMGLLKTVMEVNLSLFQAARAKHANTAGTAGSRTLLLFVIRDHIGATPLENLEKTLRADLDRLWDGLSKPDGLENSKMRDYFDMSFATLPHKLLQPAEFDAQVVTLRDRFANSSSANYVFKSAHHKRIPADGLAPYMQGVWDQILANKDLDLPTQQELLAQFRCDEIASVAFAEFEAAITPLRQPIASGQILATLAQVMKQARNVAATKFDRDASRYHASVYQRKRIDLFSKIHASLSPLFIGQLKNLHKSIVADFKVELSKELKGDSYDFAEVVSRLKGKAFRRFESDGSSLLLPETDWSVAEPLSLLSEDLDAVADVARSEETRKTVLAIERTFKKQISEPVEVALNKPSLTMWDQLLKDFDEALQKAATTYSRRAKSFNSGDEETASALTLLKQKAWSTFRAKIDEQTTDATMLVKLKFAFEERFRYDEDGVPRIWKAGDDIDVVFRKAKEDTLALIKLYAKIEPTDAALFPDIPPVADNADAADSDFDFASSLTVLTNSKCESLASSFRREADAYYVEAKRSLVSSISQVPAWLYAVMALLGWNEFVAVLRSPLYFTTLAILAGVGYVIYTLGMAGPVLKVVQAGYDQAIASVHDKLREHFSTQQPQLTRPHMNRATDEQESIELKKMQ